MLIQNLYIFDCQNGRIAIEVKQNKEDMEENKLNLKEFNLEAAKSGKPVCTRGGRKARMLCFDFKNDDYPLVAAVEEHEGKEVTLMYTNKGFFYKSENKDNLDLMMLPERKEGWVNVYKERIYSTKEEAIDATYDGVTYIDTIKVEWEE